MGVTLTMFSYVDDTYLLVTSEDYETNIKRLKRFYTKTKKWATDNGLTFEPSKHELMHFRKPWSRGQDRVLKVDIGADKMELHTDGEPLKVLGIMIDPKLRWNAQVDMVSLCALLLVSTSTKRSDQIEDKIQNWMDHHFSSVAHSVHGLTVDQLRTLYLAIAHPIITYGCAAWYHPRRDCGNSGFKCEYENGKCTRCYKEKGKEHTISIKNIRRLERINNRLTRKIVGAFDSNPAIVVEKEMSLLSIEDILDKRVIQYHQKNFDDPQARFFRQKRYGNMYEKHPYNALEALVRGMQARLREKNAKVGARGKRASVEKFPTFIKKEMEWRAKARFEVYRNQYVHDRDAWKNRPALWEPWSPTHYKLYCDDSMPRSHTTLLFQSRSGVNGTCSYLSYRNVRSLHFGIGSS